MAPPPRGVMTWAMTFSKCLLHGLDFMTRQSGTAREVLLGVGRRTHAHTTHGKLITNCWCVSTCVHVCVSMCMCVCVCACACVCVCDCVGVMSNEMFVFCASSLFELHL